MKSGLTILVVVFLILVTVAVARCGGGSDSREPIKTAADSSTPMGPAPDNNSANNPSLADTNYEKDRTRPITDTMKKTK